MHRLAEIYLAHPLVAGDLVRRAFYQHRTADKHRNLFGELEDQVHVVLDEDDRDVSRKRGDDREQLGTFRGRNTRGGLVEQQHFRPGRERQRDFQQTLLAIGKIACLDAGIALETQSGEDLPRLVDLRYCRRRRAPPDRPGTGALAARHRNRFQHGQSGKQRIDLKSARHATLDALVLREAAHSFLVEEHVTRGRREHARQQVDQGRLARAVRTDNRVPGAGIEREGDVGIGLECPERFAQSLRAQGVRHVRLRSQRRCSAIAPPIKPPRANITIATSKSPSQNCQYTALKFAR